MGDGARRNRQHSLQHIQRASGDALSEDDVFDEPWIEQTKIGVIIGFILDAARHFLRDVR
jgi:hypothetical protein